MITAWFDFRQPVAYDPERKRVFHGHARSRLRLLSATLDGYLSGHRGVALPGAIASGLCFAACAGLYLFVRRIESSAKDGETPD